MKEVHLTFDDGPHASNTIAVLDTLKLYGIKATFFLLGERIKKDSKIIERMIAEGHRAGNHTYSHKKLTTLSGQEIINEIKNTERAIANHALVDFILRPPYGARDERVNRIVKSLGYNTVLWSVDTEDWKRKPDGWINYGLEQINRRSQSLVLMHDIHSTTASGLRTFIEKIKKTDAEFVSLEKITGFPSPGGGAVPDSPAESPGGAVRYHTVKAGETLSSISAKYYGTSGRWRIIYEANKSVISNPDIIRVGMRLIIP